MLYVATYLDDQIFANPGVNVHEKHVDTQKLKVKNRIYDRRIVVITIPECLKFSFR